MRYEFYKTPWFLLLVAFVIFGCGYIVADDNRIERENKLSCQWTQDKSPDTPVKLALQESEK